jgi:hypothetical protein
MIDLTPSRDPADLIDAIYEARREKRVDLQSQVELLLEHEEPIVREEAVALLLTTWKRSELRAKAREILEGDEDFGVRGRAAIGLASITSAETRLSDAELLARVFENRETPTAVRLACFEALSLMAGRPTLVELDDTDSQKVRALVAEVARQGP